MTAQLIHVETGNLYVLLFGNRIIQIQKNTGSHINPHAIRVESLDATTDRTHVHVADRNVFMDKSTLFLDAADITTLAAWIGNQIPNASIKAFGDAVFKLFPNSMNFRDVLIAAIQIVCAPALKRAPQGEELYFITKARASDPEEFAALAAAYAEHRLSAQTLVSGKTTNSQRIQ